MDPAGGLPEARERADLRWAGSAEPEEVASVIAFLASPTRPRTSRGRPCTSTAEPADRQFLTDPSILATPSSPHRRRNPGGHHGLLAFSDEERAVRDTARDFIRKEVMPLEPEVLRRERAHQPGPGAQTSWSSCSTRRKPSASGASRRPEEDGGMNLLAVMQALIAGEVGRTFVPFRFGGEADNILYFCQRRTAQGVPGAHHLGRTAVLLRDHRAGRRIGRRQHQAVSGPGRRRLGAQRREDVFITGGNEADFAIVVAVTDKQKGVSRRRDHGVPGRPGRWVGSRSGFATMGEGGPAALVFENVQGALAQHPR